METKKRLILNPDNPQLIEEPIQEGEKVVNIIGMGWSAQDAPFGQGERWGINAAHVYGELDRVFWLHKPQLIPQSLRIGDDTKRITKIIEDNPAMRIYTLRPMLIEQDEEDHEKVVFNYDLKNPTGKVLNQTIGYPITQYQRFMRGAYATSTIMYLIGLALMEGFERIRFYGVELFSHLNDNEYEFERQGVEHLVYKGIGMGAKFEIGFQCMITASNNTNNHYGYKG